MGNRYLKAIYNELYKEEFTYEDFDDRMEMQKAVYLLEEMGVAIGNYDFMWYKHGPYSQRLQDDMYEINKMRFAEISFSDDTKIAIQKLRAAINANGEYSRAAWVECLASIHYLQENIFSQNMDEDNIIRELMKRKNHLNKEEQNKKALEELNLLFR